MCFLEALDPLKLPRIDAPERIGSPLADVKEIITVGLNYRQHATEANLPIPSEPVVFFKSTSSICGPGDDILLPPGSINTDWEIELGIVIGSTASRIDKDEARNCIAGYVMVNDVSERRWQIERGSTWTMKKVTLTFDNGPTPGVTEAILAILAERGIKTTFFVLGSHLCNPVGADLLDKIVAHEHWVGNHSFTHSVAFGDSAESGYAIHEIGDTQALIAARGISERLFRPFGNFGLLGPHLLSEEALAYLMEHRFTCIVWTSVPHDWDDPAHWVERCLSDVAKQDWTVVVLHDI